MEDLTNLVKCVSSVIVLTRAQSKYSANFIANKCLHIRPDDFLILTLNIEQLQPDCLMSKKWKSCPEEPATYNTRRGSV